AEYFTQGAHALPAALLEDVSAYDDLDQLLAVDGLDIFCLGSGDLSGSLGVPGQYDPPEVVERVEKAASAILAAGKSLLSSAAHGTAARRAAQAGHRLIACSNSGLFGRAAKEYLAHASGD